MFAASARGVRMIRDFLDTIDGAYPSLVGYDHPRWSEQYPQGDPNNRLTYRVSYHEVEGQYEATEGSGWWVGAFMNGVNRAIDPVNIVDEGSSPYWIFRMFFLNPDVEANDWQLASFLLPPADHVDKFSHMLKRAGIGNGELFTTIGTSEDIDQDTLDTYLPTGLGYPEHEYWVTSDPNSNPMDPT
ncbi:uncharacterized protein LOC62_03G003805 [Vanrija pseudolonga]|uniref:Uncharacterized protein n=1 Tax=Vanrija pseudolonga TaxID=143232 RepID=A0AAF1BGV8_9TREE|nr:hypothetical protein LOC62_03G003805 [Vanrija pseudolonga]